MLETAILLPTLNSVIGNRSLVNAGSKTTNGHESNTNFPEKPKRKDILFAQVNTLRGSFSIFHLYAEIIHFSQARIREKDATREQYDHALALADRLAFAECNVCKHYRAQLRRQPPIFRDLVKDSAAQLFLGLPVNLPDAIRDVAGQMVYGHLPTFRGNPKTAS